MTIYLSGKITGTPDYMDKFRRYQKILESEGMIVINPAEVSIGMPTTFTHEQYMRHTMPLIDEADAIYMIKDWRTSVGACMELGYAIAKGKEIMFDELS